MIKRKLIVRLELDVCEVASFVIVDEVRLEFVLAGATLLDIVLLRSMLGSARLFPIIIGVGFTKSLKIRRNLSVISFLVHLVLLVFLNLIIKCRCITILLSIR